MIGLHLLHMALSASIAIAQTHAASIQGRDLYQTVLLPRKRPHKPMSRHGSGVRAGRGGSRLAVGQPSRPWP